MKRCFVIGPIGNKFAGPDDPSRQIYEDSLEVFEDVILAACQKLEITPVRADQIAVAGEITEQVFRHIYEDDVVIADVSGETRMSCTSSDCATRPGSSPSRSVSLGNSLSM